MHDVARTGIVGESGAGGLETGQIDLVHDDLCVQPVRLGHDQKPVEHAQVRLGLRRGEDDDDLIDIGRHDTLTVPAARHPPRQHRPPRQDLHNGPGAISGLRLEQHIIAHRQLGLRRLLEAPPQCGLSRLPPGRPHDPHPARPAQHDAALGRRPAGLTRHARPARSSVLPGPHQPIQHPLGLAQ